MFKLFLNVFTADISHQYLHVNLFLVQGVGNTSDYGEHASAPKLLENNRIFCRYIGVLKLPEAQTFRWNGEWKGGQR